MSRLATPDLGQVANAPMTEQDLLLLPRMIQAKSAQGLAEEAIAIDMAPWASNDPDISTFEASGGG